MPDPFSALVGAILAKTPLQRRKVEAFLADGDDVFLQRAHRFAVNFPKAVEATGRQMSDMPAAYAELCKDMVAEQLRFQKTGRYSLASAADAYDGIYFSAEKMARYMMGLAASQFLWPNHYRLFDFFLRMMRSVDPRTYLEIGPGHGLFFTEALSLLPKARATAIDLSPTSVAFTSALVDAYGLGNRCEVTLGDATCLPRGSFDAVVMCEVLEHVDDPAALLADVRRLVADGGHLFVTTCSNCPAIDHVYLYTSEDHIRTELRSAGFEIVDDIALTVDNLPVMANGDKVVGCNYGALLRKT